MHKMWLVAQHEYLTNLKRRSFLFAAFGLPVFIGVVMIIVFGLVGNSEGTLEDAGQVGYIDEAGVLSAEVDKPATFTRYGDEATARAALDEGTLGAYFVVPSDYLSMGRVRLVNYSTSSEALRDAVENFLRANLAASLDPNIPLERVQDPVNMTVHLLDTGRTLEQEAVIGLFLVPFMFSVIFLMSSQITSGFLMSGVVEEKTNRIMEILITSVTPMQILAGKLLGLGALGLTQLVVWAVVAVVGLNFSEQIPFLQGIVIPPDLIIFGLIYFLLGYFFMASIMAGIGAVVGSEQESRQYAGIISLVLAAPFFAITSFITDPNGTVPVLLTLIPFTAPLSAIMRLSFGTIPPEQLILSIAILLATTIFIVWISARIFRWALLLYGKRVTPRELWRVIRGTSGIATTVAHSVEEA